MSSSFDQDSQNSQGFWLDLKERDHPAAERELVLDSSQWCKLLLPKRAGFTVCGLLPAIGSFSEVYRHYPLHELLFLILMYQLDFVTGIRQP